MWVQGDKLATLLGIDNSAEMAVLAQRDPGKVDHVDVKQIGALQAMHKVAGPAGKHKRQ